jgi:hypothetical protein
MTCAVLGFVILFVLPVAGMIMENQSQHAVLTETVPVILLVVAALLLRRLLPRLRFRRVRRPNPRTLAALDWPRNLTRGELEAHCAAWLRVQGWEVTLSTDPAPEAEGVYILAAKGPTTVGIMCDHRGEDFNPAIIRTFALEASFIGVTHPVLLTLLRGPLPHPAEHAARAAGVRLLRVPDLPQLDALVPAPVEA